MDLTVSSIRIPDGVAAALRARIHMGELQPGERFPAERDLADHFGVSRVKLREALRVLQDEGYVEVRRGPHGGAYITDLRQPVEAWRERMIADPSALNDLFDFRVGVEMAAARFAALRRTEGDVTAMRAAVEAMRVADTIGSYRTADSRFHTAIAVAARSSRLLLATRQLRSELFTPLDLLHFEITPDEDAKQHGALCDAIQNRDPAQAETLMCAHIERTRTTFHRELGAKSLTVGS